MPQAAGVLDLEIDRSTRPSTVRISFDPLVATLESIANAAKDALESDPFLPEPYVIRFL